MTVVYVLMGVSGCGKSSVGKALADALDCPFFDGDDFHPPANVAKMTAGHPLDDTDRAPWLALLHELLMTQLAAGETAVLACSALKETYRAQLRGESDDVQFVFLDGSFDLIWQRMRARTDHYMKAPMLQSQFDTLEPPSAAAAWRISIDQPVPGIVKAILARIRAAGM
jgi:gluconokinase